ncbi:MAG: glycogen synthase GlgA [Gammaproteobacteria bacterium]|nr:glycogen synthase GlgA [Gammaproteobacteria bacterium]
MRKSEILFVTPEAFPLMKTGGLGDVAGSLPQALKSLGNGICLIMPAYQDIVDKLASVKKCCSFVIHGYQVNLLEHVLPESQVKVWLVDCTELFARKGNPYLDTDGNPYADNARRFALFSQVVVEVAMNRVGLNWKPDVVHCNDWQTGLVPALLTLETERPATIFTIHNLAYQGVFPGHVFDDIGIPERLRTFDALEFFGNISFIKGGLVFADQITTVSLSYAKEIQTPEFGYGLDGLLNYRGHVLSGILNGIDEHEWDPMKDKNLVSHYDAWTLEGKLKNKSALQKECGLPVSNKMLLIGSVGRLVEQKGIDFVIDALPAIFEMPVQIIMLGSGQKIYEKTLVKLMQKYPKQLFVRIGYSESLAHRIEAGADCFLMPSRFEPCGLNQMYSLRYGTLPIVRNVGGLADTVVDATSSAIKSGKANGIIINESADEDLTDAIKRTHELFGDTKIWQGLQRRGMKTDFSWLKSAKNYMAVYQKAMRHT